MSDSRYRTCVDTLRPSSSQGAANFGDGAKDHLFAALVDTSPASLWCRSREVE
jgi:hypothetical protein